MSKTVKWLAAGLFVSMAINVFILGLIAGRQSIGRPGPTVPVGVPLTVDFTFRSIAKALPDDARDALRDGLENRRQQLRPVFFERRRLLQDVAELMTAEEVDQEALSEAFARVRALSVELQRPIHDTIVEVAPMLSVEERERMVTQFARMERRLSGGRHGRDRYRSEIYHAPGQ